MSVNYEDKDIFIVGCDSGGLFKCSFSSNIKATSSKSLFKKRNSFFNLNLLLRME